jgi:hypothetical protein
MPASRTARMSGAWNAVQRENTRNAAQALIAVKKA